MVSRGIVSRFYLLQYCGERGGIYYLPVTIIIVKRGGGLFIVESLLRIL